MSEKDTRISEAACDEVYECKYWEQMKEEV